MIFRPTFVSLSVLKLSSLIASLSLLSLSITKGTVFPLGLSVFNPMLFLCSFACGRIGRLEARSFKHSEARVYLGLIHQIKRRGFEIDFLSSLPSLLKSSIMTKLILALSLVSLIPFAAFGSESLLLNNLAYLSPSVTVSHGGLAHDVSEIARVNKRDLVVPFAGKLDFPYGVASGDPYEDSAILWTHPIPKAQKDTKQPICLKYKTSTSKRKWKGSSIVDSGTVQTTKDVDYS